VLDDIPVIVVLLNRTDVFRGSPHTVPLNGTGVKNWFYTRMWLCYLNYTRQKQSSSFSPSFK